MAGIKRAVKVAVFDVYEYFGFEYARGAVYVDRAKKSPDPSGLMIWGKAIDGGLVSDFKGRFSKTGKNVKLNYSEASTASQEQANKVDAVRVYLAGINV